MGNDATDFVWKCRLPAWSLIVLALTAAPATAHGIRVSAHAHGDTIHGEVKAGGGIPVSDAKVTALDPAGEKIGQTTTDEEGRFTMKARVRCDHRLLIDTGDGHGADCLIPAAQLSAKLPAGGGLESLSSQMAQLQEQLADHAHETRLRDVLGGLGYIVGLAGVAFYFLGVRRRQARQ